jgi:hypothetical protein
MARRRTIKLNPIDHGTLAKLYVTRRIATDRYMNRPDDLRDLTDTFNGLTGREDTPEDILHYMQTKRRTKDAWPTLDGDHLRLPVVLGHLIEREHTETLKKLFLEFGRGVEAFTHEPDLARALEKRFAEETGVRNRGYVLATAMLELRKAGLLPTLGPREDGFGDFDAAEDVG